MSRCRPILGAASARRSSESVERPAQFLFGKPHRMAQPVKPPCAANLGPRSIHERMPLRIPAPLFRPQVREFSSSFEPRF
jgi:hypothetical protein